jgi:Flp pilus assembly protein TadD
VTQLEGIRGVKIRVGAVVLAVAIAVTGCSSGKHKSSPSASASQIAKLLQDGIVAENKGQFQDAIAKYQQVVQIDPTNKIAHYDLGVVYQTLKQDDQAAAEYGRAIALDPKYTSALFNYAVLESNRNRTHAIDLYRELLTLRPNDPNVHFNLGLVLQANGQKAEGATELDTAFKLDPSLRKRLPSSAPASTSPAPASSSPTH